MFRFMFFFSSRRRHTRFDCDWSSDVCSSDLLDGSKVIAAFLPESLRRAYLRFGRYGMTVLLLLVFVVPILAAQAGIRFDIFGWLVLGPAEALTRALLSLFGQ